MKNLLIVFLALLSYTSFAQNDAWNISTTTNENYTGIVVANGRIGILPSKNPLEVEHIILNNVYDRKKEFGVNQFIKGMNFGNLDLEIDGEKITAENISAWKQTLNMKEAKFTTSFTFKNKALVTYIIFTPRNAPYLGYINVQVNAKQNVKVKATGRIDVPSEYKNPSSIYRTVKSHEKTMPFIQTVAKSKFERNTVATSATFTFKGINPVTESLQPEFTHTKDSEYTNKLSFEKELKENTTLDFSWIGSQCTTADFNNPRMYSERFIVHYLLSNKTDFFAEHNTLWEKLWEGDIIIEGDLQSQQDVRLALYHLYSFAREGSDLSISPMGLSSQAYGGHVFWDTELWMYPPLLVFNQGIAKSLVNYRSDRLEAAKKKAESFNYKGAMFPWESADNGEEETNITALTGIFQHHVSADVAIAFWNYYRVTKDKKWLADEGFTMFKEVADFWVSRVVKNSDGSYSINNVIGADEYAINVDDNAFTNGAAITALKYATLAAKELNKEVPEMWETVANNIKIHKFSDGTIKEFSSYNGEIIKQADVNLLTYPLGIVSDKETLLKNLNYYEPKLHPNGPAMGKAIFAVIYARLGDAKKAFRLYKESYEPNKRTPFGALAEKPKSNNPYFATGAGGMLQTVLFGFGGLHFTDEGIIQKNPILPKQWKSLTIKGVGVTKSVYTVK